MTHTKKSVIIAALAAFVILGTAATTSRNNTFRNLKVLPQDISEHRLDSIMDSYNRALKVNCEFCHKPPQNVFPMSPVTDGPPDFALDNEMKENARKMIRMTIDINKTNFRFDTTGRPEYLLNVVTCNTCHRGNPFPAHE